MDFSAVRNKVQRADPGQHRQLRFAQLRHPDGKILNGREGGAHALAQECPGCFLAQTMHVAQSEPHALAQMFLDRAVPIRARDVDREKPQPVTLRVLDDRRRMIEAHRLVVEQRGGEGGQVVTL